MLENDFQHLKQKLQVFLSFYHKQKKIEIKIKTHNYVVFYVFNSNQQAPNVCYSVIRKHIYIYIYKIKKAVKLHLNVDNVVVKVDFYEDLFFHLLTYSIG